MASVKKKSLTPLWEP